MQRMQGTNSVVVHPHSPDDPLDISTISFCNSTMTVENEEERPQDFAIVDHALHFDNVQAGIPRAEDGTTSMPSSKLSLSVQLLTDSILDELSASPGSSRRITMDQDEVRAVNHTSHQSYVQEPSTPLNRMSVGTDIETVLPDKLVGHVDHNSLKSEAGNDLSPFSNENSGTEAVPFFPCQVSCVSTRMEPFGSGSCELRSAFVDREEHSITPISPLKATIIITVMIGLGMLTRDYLSAKVLLLRKSAPTFSALNATPQLEEEDHTTSLFSDFSESASSKLVDEKFESSVGHFEMINIERKAFALDRIAGGTASEIYRTKQGSLGSRDCFVKSLMWSWHKIMVALEVLIFLSATCCCKKVLQFSKTTSGEHCVEVIDNKLTSKKDTSLYELVKQFDHEPKRGRATRGAPAETFGLSSVEVESFQSLELKQLRMICTHLNVVVKGRTNKSTLIYAVVDAYKRALEHSSKCEIITILSLKRVAFKSHDSKSELVRKALTAGI